MTAVTRLNLGCGHHKLPGYVNIDIDERTNPDMVRDLTKGLKFLKDNSVTHIYSSHFLEHLPPDAYEPFLREMYRVSTHNCEWTLVLPIDNPRNRACVLHYRTYWWGCWTAYRPRLDNDARDIVLIDETPRLTKLDMLFASWFALALKEIRFTLRVVKEHPRRTLVISEKLFGATGGAEHSLREQLEREPGNISVLTFDRTRGHGFSTHRDAQRRSWLVLNYPLPQIPHLPRLTAWLAHSWVRWRTREHLRDIGVFERPQHIVIQSKLAPSIAHACRDLNLPYTYYVRDETNLNVFRNYEEGFRRLCKYAQMALEAPALWWYGLSNQAALRGASEIVCNSLFSQRLLSKKFALESRVCYPRVGKIRRRRGAGRYVLFFGEGDAAKGCHLAHRIAAALPELDFVFVGDRRGVERNICYVRRGEDSDELFAGAALVIVPSRWMEFYGRVVAESLVRGVPVLAHDTGGISETGISPRHLLPVVDSPDCWVREIRRVLSR